MTDLHRLSEGTLSSFERAALRSASRDRPSPAARLAAEAALGLAAPGAIVSGTSGTAVATKITSGVALTKVVGLTAIALVIATAVVVVARSHADGAREAAAPSSTNPADAAELPTRADVPLVVPVVSIDELPSAHVRTFPAVPSARGRSAIRPPAPAASRLGEEIARLAEVRTKLSAGDTAGAHSALDAYAREFGAGMLAPEAAALRIDTFVAAGNRVRALEGAHRYLADFPTGPAAPRMHGLVASVGASSP